MVLIYPTFLHQILHKKFTRLYRNLYMGLWAAFWPLIPIGHLRLFSNTKSILRRVYSTFVEGHIVYVHVIAIGPACAHASHVVYSYHRVLCTVVPSQLSVLRVRWSLVEAMGGGPPHAPRPPLPDRTARRLASVS